MKRNLKVLLALLLVLGVVCALGFASAEGAPDGLRCDADGIWRLEVMPDQMLLSDPFAKASQRKEVNTILWHQWPMTIDLPDLGEGFSYCEIDVRTARQGTASGKTLEVIPGTWLLARRGVSTASVDPEARLGNIRLDEFVAPGPRQQTMQVLHEPVRTATAGQPLALKATVIGPADPDSVLVYGEPYHLENINMVYTKAIELSNLKSSAHGSVKLEPVQGLRMSEQEVGYSLEVTRYVEISTEVAVTPRNVPAGMKLSVYPSTARVVYKCVFPLTHDPSDVVSFNIDYNDFQKSIGGRCMANHSKMPDGVIEYSIEPEVFDCVEESAR